MERRLRANTLRIGRRCVLGETPEKDVAEKVISIFSASDLLKVANRGKVLETTEYHWWQRQKQSLDQLDVSPILAAA